MADALDEAVNPESFELRRDLIGRQLRQLFVDVEIRKELARFLSIAAGSASELEYQLLLAHDLEYRPRDAYAALYDQIAEVKRMLCRFMQSLGAPGLTGDR